MSAESMNNIQLATMGLLAFQAEDYEKAVEFLGMLAKRDPDRWECRLHLSQAYTKLSQYGNALQELRDIIESCPDGHIKERAVEELKAMKNQSLDKLDSLRSRK
jgi:tetratricopeptide (TPR) repeat protein